MSTVIVDHQLRTPPLTHSGLDYGHFQLVPIDGGQDSPQNHDSTTHDQPAQQAWSTKSPEIAMQDPRIAAPYPPQYYAYSQYPDLQDPNAGLGIQFGEQYGASGAAYYHHDSSMNHNLPYSNSGMQISDPPTPRSIGSDGRRTRSGRSATRTTSPPVGGNSSRSRVSKPSPKPRRSKASKSEKPKTPKLTAPLSELTKDMKIPVRDMEEWVNRPIEVRQQEVDKRKGYVTRPMNSFMLYRSAYADRTKEWCRQNNHQVVSSVSGESWPKEPAEVREKYNDLAKLERTNHQNAHPTYKFSPSKAGQSRKRKGTDSDENEEEEMSDYDDGDAAWTPSGQRRSKPRPVGRLNRDADYSNEMAFSDPYGRSFGPNGNFNKSTWEATNEGRPLPTAIGGYDPYRQHYLQASIHPSAGAPGVEDIRYQMADAPGLQFQATQPLLGLPGGQHFDLMDARTATPMSYEDPVDPKLLESSIPAPLTEQDPVNFAIVGTDSQFDQQYAELGLFDGEAAPATNAEWELEPNMGDLAADTDFGKWEEDFPASN